MSENGDILDPEVREYDKGGGGNGQLPNAVATLVLGIISIIGCFLYGIPGLICGIIAISLHQKDRRLYKENQAYYTNSYKTANAGYVCAIIGTSLSALYFLIVLFIFLGLLSSGGFR